MMVLKFTTPKVRDRLQMKRGNEWVMESDMAWEAGEKDEVKHDTTLEPHNLGNDNNDPDSVASNDLLKHLLSHWQYWAYYLM